MANFPTSFETPTPLPDGISAAADAELTYLNQQGFKVYAGLSPEFAEQYARLGHETEIAEMCPKDATKSRFGTTAAAEGWVGKGDDLLREYGRGVITIVDTKLNPDVAVAAFGWVGPERPSAPLGTVEHRTPPELVDEFNVVMGGLGLRTTYAIRVGERHAGKGLSRPLNTLLVHAGNALYGATDFWLETWKSNHAGPKVYAPGGWKKRPIEIPAMRPSVKAGHDVPDVRTWYTYPNDKLPSNS